jgi:hypothetical protein
MLGLDKLYPHHDDTTAQNARQLAAHFRELLQAPEQPARFPSTEDLETSIELTCDGKTRARTTMRTRTVRYTFPLYRCVDPSEAGYPNRAECLSTWLRRVRDARLLDDRAHDIGAYLLGLQKNTKEQ